MKRRSINANMFAMLILLVVFIPLPAQTCGWWGDGEMGRNWSSPLKNPDGQLVPETISLKTAKLPGRKGYGIAVLGPGKAVPYLQATYGRPLNQISELKAFGFVAVIYVGTAVKTAQPHKTKTETVGMRYYHIPVEGNTASVKQTKRFSHIISQSNEGPLFVYAPTSSLLGMIWASHRLNHGASFEFSLMEGQSFGITVEQKSILRQRIRANQSFNPQAIQRLRRGKRNFEMR